MNKIIILFMFLASTLLGRTQYYNNNISFFMMGNEPNSIETLDGGNLTFGRLMSGSPFLIKTSNIGDTVWTRTIATADYSYVDVVQYTDSSYFFAGISTVSAAGSIGIINISKDGSSILSANDYSFSGLSGASGFSQIKTVVNVNGNLVTVACLKNGDNLIVLVTNPTGAIISQQSIFLPFPNTPAPTWMQLGGLSVEVLNNGNIIIGGVSLTDVNNYLYIIELDQNGNMVWQKLMQTNTATIVEYKLHNIKEMPDGKLLLAGSGKINGTNGTTFMQLDASGNVIFSKYFDDGSTSNKVTADGNGVIYLASCANNSIDNFSRIGVYKFTSTGNLIKNSLYGWGVGIYSIKVSNLFVSGNSLKVFSGGADYLNLISVDSMFNGAACQDIPTPVSITNFTPPFISWLPSFQTISAFSLGVSYNLSNSLFVVSSMGLTTSGTITQPLCNGDLGQIDYSVAGGTSPYIYTWSNGTNSQNLVNAPAGQHRIRIADSKGCVQIDTFVIVEPPQLSASFQKTDVTCFSAFDGGVNLTVGGGTPGYSYFWANGAQTQDISNLGGGFYQVTITDTNGCQLTQGISVAEPGPLTASIIGFQDVSCFGLCDGVLNGNASGGTAPYNYVWNDPFSQYTSTADSLCTGNYLLTLTDANGCNAYTSAYVGQPIQLQHNITTTNANCGIADGSAIVSTTGGIQPYTYVWSNGNSGNSNTNLDAGNYYIMGYDANGCGDSAIFQIGVDVYSVSVCEITVDSTSTKNKIIWEKPIVSNLAGFNIYRDVVGLYQLIDFVPYDSLSEYTDASNGIAPSTTSYRYKISAIDTCGNEGARSAYHETIHLTTNLGLNNEVNLIWDGYKGFPVGYYRIIVDSSDNNIQDYYVKDSVSYTNFTWTDNNPPTGNYLVYAIEVVTPSTCSVTKAIDHNTTRSNRATVIDGSQNPSSIEESVLAQAKLYPNPSNGIFSIEVYATNWSYQIMDMGGKLLQSNSNENYKTQVDISSFETGIYLVKIEIGNSYVFKKLVKN